MEGVARRFYAVRQGRIPGIYTSWPAANRQVKGFSNCQHRSFATLEEAVAYMDRGDDINDGALAEQPIMVPPLAEVGPVGGARIHGGRGRGTHAANTSSTSSFCSWQNRQMTEYSDTGSMMGSSTAGGSGGYASSSMSASGGSTMRRATVQAHAGEDMVPQFDAIEFVSVDDMEQLLLRFCFELQIGAPEFSRCPIIWMEGRRLFAYEVTLPPNRRGIAGRIQGRYSYDENRARQDGAYNMVGHIRRVAGVEVHDFHFEELMALREEADALRRHAYERDAELRTFSDRLNEQEALVADLRTQLKGYEDIFAQVP